MGKKSVLTPRLPFIRTLPAYADLRKEDVCIPELLLQRQGAIEVYYAPFDFVNLDARIVIVGITPGWQQMKMAYEVFRDALHEGASVKKALMRADVEAAFVGAMRRNMTTMFDEIGVARAFGLPSSQSLFGENRVLAHTTSALRYPVFVNGDNYTGHNPSPFGQPTLEAYWRYELPSELRRIEGTPLIVPLGKAVSQILSCLIDDKVIQKEYCLLGFPHPSGANGHQRVHFDERKEELKKVVRKWSRLAK